MAVPNSSPKTPSSRTPAPENVHEFGAVSSATLNGEVPGRMKQLSRPENGVLTVTTRDVSTSPGPTSPLISFIKSTAQPIFNCASVIVKSCVGEFRITGPPAQLPLPPAPTSGSTTSALVVLPESIITVNNTNH